MRTTLSYYRKVAPVLLTMTIEFLCPNGHRIHCSREQVGRPGKCPRCGVRFVIPAPGNGDAGGASGNDVGEAITEPEQRPAPRPAPPRPRGGERQIEFLCPQGHRLHGPESLQGKSGECPECGTRFRIPVYDDVAEDEQLEHDITAGHAGEPGSDVTPGSGIHRNAMTPAGPAPGGSGAGGSGLAANLTQGRPPHPFSLLVARLWVEKLRGATLEIHLADGEKFQPDYYAKLLSQADLAVFSRKEEGGTFGIVVVPWSSVVRVGLTGVKKMPEGMSS